MTIDLSNPIVIGVSISIISAAILGIIHYVKTLVQLNFTDKKLSNVISELDTLHKNYKNEIADIKKRHADETTDAFDRAFNAFIAGIDILLKHNKPPLEEPESRNLLVRAEELEQKIKTIEENNPALLDKLPRGRFDI